MDQGQGLFEGRGVRCLTVVSSSCFDAVKVDDLHKNLEILRILSSNGRAKLKIHQ